MSMVLAASALLPAPQPPRLLDQVRERALGERQEKVHPRLIIERRKIAIFRRFSPQFGVS